MFKLLCTFNAGALIPESISGTANMWMRMYKLELSILTDDLKMKRINKRLIDNNVVCRIATNVDGLYGCGKSILCAYLADIAGHLQQRLSGRRGGAL